MPNAPSSLGAAVSVVTGRRGSERLAQGSWDTMSGLRPERQSARRLTRCCLHGRSFKTYQEATMPIIQLFESKGKVRKIDTSGPIPEVWEAVKKTIKEAM